MPYGHPLCSICWGHIFRKYGVWGWSELLLFFFGKGNKPGTKISPKMKFLERISRGHPGSFVRISRPRTSEKQNKHLGADIHNLKAQTSTTARDLQGLWSEKLWAEFSFPNKSGCRQSPRRKIQKGLRGTKIVNKTFVHKLAIPFENKAPWGNADLKIILTTPTPHICKKI